MSSEAARIWDYQAETPLPYIEPALLKIWHSLEEPDWSSKGDSCAKGSNGKHSLAHNRWSHRLSSGPANIWPISWRPLTRVHMPHRAQISACIIPFIIHCFQKRIPGQDRLWSIQIHSCSGAAIVLCEQVQESQDRFSKGGHFPAQSISSLSP